MRGFSGAVSALLLSGAVTLPASREHPAHDVARGAVGRSAIARRTVVRGAVVLPDDGSPIGLYAYLTSEAGSDSVAVDAAGTFALPMADMDCRAVTLGIDTPDGTERRYHRAVIRLDAARPPASRFTSLGRADTLPEFRILLIPTHVTIDGGSYSGLRVPIHVDAALAGRWERTRFWRVARSAPDGFGTPVAWPEALFPVPVSLRARGGVSSADSAAFWRAARQLEADFGRSLFEPAPDAPAVEEIWRIIVMVEPAAAAAGITYVTYDSHGAIYEATVALRSATYLGDAPLVSHELLHALGLGHSSGWRSASSPTYGSVSRVTAADVAHAQLLYRLRRAHTAQRATHGLLASAAEPRRPISAVASRCAR